MKKNLIIIGASGHGKVAADIAFKMNQWQSISFLDDEEVITTCMGLKIVGKVNDAVEFKEKADFFIAIGNNSLREKILKEFFSKGLSIATLIHPNAVIGSDVEVGSGTIIMAGVVVNSSTVIRKGCIVNTSSSIDHDNFIDDYVHISPGVRTAGTVKIGKGTWLGIGAIVSNNVNICGGCQIGAGTVVLKDIVQSGIYVGTPVRKIK